MGSVPSKTTPLISNNDPKTDEEGVLFFDCSPTLNGNSNEK